MRMAKQMLDEIHLTLSKAVLIRDAFTGKGVTNGIQVQAAGGYKPVLKPGGYCLFLNLDTDTIEVEITSAIYQSCRLVLTADGGSKAQEIFLYPSAAYPVGRNTTVVSGQAPAGAMLYFHLEEKRREYRLLHDYKKGEKEISIFTGGTAAAVGGLWFIREQNNSTGEYFRSLAPADGSEAEEEPEAERGVLEQTLQKGYRKKDARLYPAFACAAGEDGMFYLFLNQLKEQDYRLFFSCEQDGAFVNREIGIRGCVYNTVETKAAP